MKKENYEFYEKIIRDEFTSKYTEVASTSEKNFNAYHNYVVTNVETGEVIQEIHFQEGPIKENGINGVNNEDLILMVVDRLNSFQHSEYACEENAAAIECFMKGIRCLRERTNKRAARGVEGTSIV